MDKNECLVIDIECYSSYDIDSPQYIQDAKIKWIGLYSFKQNAYSEVLVANDEEIKPKIIDFINKHNALITFNGNKFDNRIENLKLLCPNCHAFTDNYRAKNMSAR
jgi:hypothetical protein